MPVQSVRRHSLVDHAKSVPAAFKCSWSTDGLDAAFVHVAGELDIATTPQLEQALSDCFRAAPLVVLDLHDVTFIGSCGVDAIVDASIRARPLGRRLVLLRGPPDVDRVIALTGSHDQVEIVDVAPVQPIGQALRLLAAADTHPQRESDDERLMQRLSDGNVEALATIYDRHAANVHALARRMCGAASADEIVVQVFAKLRDNARGGPIPGGIGLRLLRITRRCAREAMSAADHRSRSLPSGVTRLYERHAAAALQSVAPPQRDCIELAYFDGLDIGEIAARRGVSPAAVSDHLRQGLDGMLRYLSAKARSDARGGRTPLAR